MFCRKKCSYSVEQVLSAMLDTVMNCGVSRHAVTVRLQCVDLVNGGQSCKELGCGHGSYYLGTNYGRGTIFMLDSCVNDHIITQ